MIYAEFQKIITHREIFEVKANEWTWVGASGGKFIGENISIFNSQYSARQAPSRVVLFTAENWSGGEMNAKKCGKKYF